MTDENLLFQAKNGNLEAMEKIIKQYQRIVYKNSKDFFLKGGDTKDLEQEGYIGLIKAIKNYHNNTNASFATFAHICVRRQMISAVKKSNTDKYKNLNNAIQGEGYSEKSEKIDYKTPSISLYSPEDLLLGKELVQLLNNYLDEKLSSFEKQVFYYLAQQKTYVEIADILDDRPKRIDNTIQRIKKKIKEYLEEYRK
ncbi:sigma-70 family RNA polymerase sigma factor [Cetobacterium somerae]|uniref:sigma-70 family RNA polymerase sigma factor n=1 Tax=Cetobacterium somerae TaxID=188913 RepID=UPI003D7668D2